MNTKTAAATLLGAASLILLTGCSSTPEPVSPPSSDDFNVEIADVSDREFREGYVVDSPSSMKVLIGGGSTCPADIERVAMEKDTIVIYHVVYPSFQACSEDFALTAYRITTEKEDISFEELPVVLDKTGERYELENFTPQN